MGRQEKDNQLLTAGDRRSGGVLRKGAENRDRGNTGGTEAILEGAWGIAGVDPLSLPSVGFAERQSLPECSGIYFVIDGDREVVYIGKAKNIFSRWISHHRANQVKACIAEARIAWLLVPCNELAEAELKLIEVFAPKLNGQQIPREFQWQKGGARKSISLSKRSVEALAYLAQQTGKSDTSLISEAIMHTAVGMGFKS